MHSFLPQEFIRQIRDGEQPPDEHLQHFIAGISDQSTSDAQIAAFAMAVFFNELSLPKRQVLTSAMRDSGDILHWPELKGPILDKHSTGGVGDNVSLILAPVIAACGGYVPMISGRGLGHTGGTLDKMEAIPGYNTVPDNPLFRKVVNRVGCAIIGQTVNLAPADKKIYAIRSATATVESISLITASILSKKLAAGLDGLMLDIKCGNGAVMSDLAHARKLAISLIETGNALGVKTSGLITAMDQPLASAAGNALEVSNALKFLSGEHCDSRLQQVVFGLCGKMLLQGQLATSSTTAHAKISQVLKNGQAAEVFSQMVNALGGPADLLHQPEKYLSSAPIIEDIPAPCSGTINAIDTREIGLAVIVLGGGRKKASDAIDSRVGFDRLLSLGDTVEKSQPIARIHAASRNNLEQARKMLLSAYKIGDAVEKTPTIIEISEA